MSDNSNLCPQCGATIPTGALQGLCPKCLLAGVAAPTDAGSGDPARRPPPPSREALAPAFPQLEILELIGVGGMGAVFKARQPKLNRFVALKILPESLGRDPKFAGRFAREGQLLARLNHPNIVSVHDFGFAALSTLNPQPSTSPSGFFYLLMEFVDGVNLRQAMRAGRFTAAQALGIVPKICEALQYAHDEGVLHRDIKPENILLDTKGRVKLADFGIAKFIGDVEAADLAAATAAPDAAAASPQLTSASAALGTPNYMAPEQRDRPADVDHRADIYSLGVVFYEMLTGELPLGKFAAPSAKNAVDPRVDAVVLRALEQQRERRQQSAGEMKTQVDTIASSSGSSRREEAQNSSAPSPRLLNTSACHISTPEQLAKIDGLFSIFLRRGQMLLDERQLTFARAGTTTVIPLAAIRDLSIGHYPRVVNPVGLDFISVTYDDAGQTQRLFFSPSEGLFGSPWRFNEFVGEWFNAIRDAVTAATGRAPGHTPAEQLGVTRGSKWAVALVAGALLAPIILGGLAIWLVFSMENVIEFVRSVKPEFVPALILILLGVPAAALGRGWFFRRKRGATQTPGGAPGPAARKDPRVGCFVGALVLALLLFATIAGVYLLSYHKAPSQAEGPEQAAAVARAAGPQIERVEVGNDNAIVRLRRYDGEGMFITFGPTTNRWTPGGLYLEAMFDITLGGHWLGHGADWVVKTRHGIHMSYRLDGPPGPMLGKIAFHSGTPAPEADGSYVIGEFRPDKGAPLPIAVRLERDSAKTVAPPPSSPAFGPVIERELSYSERLAGGFLNLDTGEVLSAPQEIADLLAAGKLNGGDPHDPAIRDWMRSSGADVVIQAMNPPMLFQADGFVGALAAPQQAKPKTATLENVSVADVLRQVENYKPNSDQTPNGAASYFEPTCVSAFVTREGGIGILEITRIEGRTVKLRYKLVQGGVAKAAVPQATTDSPRQVVVEFLRLISAEHEKKVDAAQVWDLTTRSGEAGWGPDFAKLADRIRPLHQLGNDEQAIVLSAPFRADDSDRPVVHRAHLLKRDGKWLIKSHDIRPPAEIESLVGGFLLSPGVKFDVQPAELVGEWHFPCSSKLTLNADGTGVRIFCGPSGEPEKPEPFHWSVSGSLLKTKMGDTEGNSDITWMSDDGFHLSYLEGPSKGYAEYFRRITDEAAETEKKAAAAPKPAAIADPLPAIELKVAQQQFEKVLGDLLETQAALASEGEKYNKTHPVMMKLEAKLKALEEQAAQLRARIQQSANP